MVGVRQTELETDCEITWMKLDIAGSKSVYVASYYRPHEADKRSLDELQKSLSKICNQTSSHVWVGGDFNFPGYNWKKEHLKPRCNQPELTRNFLDLIADNNLTQVVKEPTYHENTLDLLLMSNPSVVQNIQVIPGISNDGHHAVYAEVDISLARQTRKPRKVHSYRRADWEGLRAHMTEFRDAFMTDTSTQTPVDTLLANFTSELLAAIDKFIPSRQTKTREKPPWISLETVRLIRKQHKLFDKQRGCAYASRASKQYRSFKAFVQRSVRKSYWEHIRGIIGASEGPDGDTTNPLTTSKRFWQFIKHRRQDAQGVAPLKKDGQLVPDALGKATILNEQFQSAFSPRTPLPLRYLCQQNQIKPGLTPMLPITVTENGVLKLLKKLKPHKAAGPDNIRPLVLKELAETIAPMVTRIFQASMEQGVVPGPWKEANVTPVFKKGEKYRAVNYRPVSLTCILSKQMEHIIASQIMNHLNSNNLLYAKQHGFRSKLSCETQLIEFTNDILQTVQDRRQCDAIVLDFSKAFDKVSHDRLLFKLGRLGLDGQTCSWIRSFLSNRVQRVVVDGESSAPAPVTSGVPQGSVLGPILFLAFINDLPEYVLHSQVRLFADDTVVYLTVNSVDDCAKLQEDLYSLERWERDWLMSFHPAKCNVLRITRKRTRTIYNYTLHGEILEGVSSAKYLGVTLSEDMSWNRHVDSVVSRSNSKLGFLKRNLKINDSKLKEQAYKAIVRPSLEYSSTVWDPYTAQNSKRIEMVQRRAARWVTGRFHNTSSVQNMLDQLGWRTLADRRADYRLAMLYKIRHGLVAVPLGSFCRLQRNCIHFQPILARTQYFQYSFFPRTIMDWNNLPPDILTSETVASFKRRVATVAHAMPY